MSSSASASATASAAATSAATGTLQTSSSLKIVGIVLAIASGCLIGTSFVFKKKGLLRSQAGHAAGEGVSYLKSPLWWTGMTMMILGELCNFAAYAFIEALVVTPMGALSVVISAILSSLFLNEKLSFFGWIGCALCILGSIIIALNGPQEPQVGQITQFQKLFLAPGFLAYGGTLIAASLTIIFYFAPKYGKTHMMWYIGICSMIGGISVSVTTGLGAAIVTTAMGSNQFKHWFIYFLFVFVATTLVTEVYYLNVALALFNTAMVTPTYYVLFTFCSMVTTVVLFQGLRASASQILTVVFAFLVICLGITLLQMSKIDPQKLTHLDRRSTMLLQAARSTTADADEKDATGLEDPGIDSLRGSFGTIGSIIRARTVRRLSQSGGPGGGGGARPRFAGGSARGGYPGLPSHPADPLAGMRRHQLFDPPVRGDEESAEGISMQSQPTASSLAPPLGSPPAGDGDSQRRTAVKFGAEDLVHQYSPAGRKGGVALHESRTAAGGAAPAGLPDEVRTAPPVPGAGFYSPPRIDPFAGDPATAALASYPSASDSVGSAGEAPWNEEGARRGGHRVRYGSRRYPSRGNEEEDREESVSLWQRPSVDASEEDLPHMAAGSIRLVPGDGGAGHF